VADLTTDQVDMHGVVTRAVEAVRGFADDTGTELRLHLPTEVYAEVDPRRVERIIRNLVANAVDHGEGRPVDVTLAGDATTVAVVVRDHGVGLRPGEAALVFNRFWRAEESRARRSGGSGLGLSISIEDARLHGGWLQAWGEPGRGSAFRLTLPCTIGEPLTASPLPLVPDDRVADPDPAPPSSTSAPAGGSVPTPVHGMPLARVGVARAPDALLAEREEGR
jgi:two-component system sensor histidine kinase MtrB